MNFEIISVPELSSSGTTVYTILPRGASSTLLDDFAAENMILHKKEVQNILKRLEIMGKKEGFRYDYFKHEEGLPGDLVCALYDNPDSNLRLYCIRYGTATVIIGGGGHKPKDIRAWQEDPVLKKHAREMIHISKVVYQRIREKDITWNGSRLEGNLKFFGEEND
jgi:hypothetical protein